MKDSTWDFPSHKLHKYMTRFIECLPIKICCIHGCVSSLFATVLIPIVKYLLPREERQIFQVHNSIKTPTILNNLESFGLHRDNLPKSIGGNYDVKPSWIYECERIIQEQQNHRQKNKRQRHVTSTI